MTPYLPFSCTLWRSHCSEASPQTLLCLFTRCSLGKMLSPVCACFLFFICYCCCVVRLYIPPWGRWKELEATVLPRHRLQNTSEWPQILYKHESQKPMLSTLWQRSFTQCWPFSREMGTRRICSATSLHKPCKAEKWWQLAGWTLEITFPVERRCALWGL